MTKKNIFELKNNLNTLISDYSKLIKSRDYNASLNVLKHIDILNKMLESNCRNIEVGHCEIVHTNTPHLKVGGASRIFSAKFYDSENNAITSLIPKWKLIIPDDLAETNPIVVVNERENEIVLKAKPGDSSIDKSFILRASCEDEKYGYFESEIEITLCELF